MTPDRPFRYTHVMRPIALDFAAACSALALAGCADVWNDPYPSADRGKNIFYSAFTERPKHLDPVQSYSENEATFLFQIYEPPLQYDYLKRPYRLIPMSTEALPSVTYLDREGNPLPADANGVAIGFSVYEIRIKPGIRYQPHPAFAVDAAGKPRYLGLTREQVRDKRKLSDFAESGTRELTSDDYIYQIKRLAHPRLHSPAFELLADYVVGLRDLQSRLAKADTDKSAWLDLSQHELSGVERVDQYTFRIKLMGKYPQFVYWLAMPFFAPVPLEADRFFAQPGMSERNLTLDWYPIGTGPYMLTENNPNARMVLERNPNYHGDTYPCEGEAGDREAGLLADCGKPLPFVDKVVFSLEKETIPYWNKFIQGYYDVSGVGGENFDQAVRFGPQGDARLTDDMQERGMTLVTAVQPTVSYTGFNMLDPVVGGSSERARKLRQAISIAVDQEEYVSIFLSGRGEVAQSPIPPGITGRRGGRDGMNPVVYDWVDGKPRRKAIAEAKRLLAEAGYPNGRDSQTGEPLVIHLDTTGGGVGDKSRVDWYNKQFSKLDIQLVVRSTDYNRFQDKMRKGTAQMFFWGWNADYPDPENFLFLFHGPQAKVKTQGENAANYENPDYDALFEKMKNMDEGTERQEIIDRMVRMLQTDAPWLFGYHDVAYVLQHGWMSNRKAGKIIRGNMKYQKVDVSLREKRRAEWNAPIRWPIAVMLGLLAAIIAPAVISYRRRERERAIPDTRTA